MTLRHGRVRGRAVAVPNASRADLIVTLAKSLDGYGPWQSAAATV